jgi:hypothetical protein
MSDDEIRLVNPIALVVAGSVLAASPARAMACQDTNFCRDVDQNLGCGVYNDLPVCKDGNSDVSCWSEVYRGCNKGETDCADCLTSSDNQNDVCCAGISPIAGDHIDHQYCWVNDAKTGTVSICWPGFDGNPPSDWFLGE